MFHTQKPSFFTVFLLTGLFFILASWTNAQESFDYKLFGTQISESLEKNKVDLSEHKSGVYIVKIFTKSEIYSYRIIKN